MTEQEEKEFDRKFEDVEYMLKDEGYALKKWIVSYAEKKVAKREAELVEKLNQLQIETYSHYDPHDVLDEVLALIKK